MTSTRLLCSCALLFLLVGSVYASAVTLNPTTALHKAYYRALSQQSGSPPTNPSWAESTNTEFASADYTAVDTDDDSLKTSRAVSASINGRWCAAEELYTFDLSAYPSITKIVCYWNGTGASDVNVLANQLWVKTNASTWTDVGALPTYVGPRNYTDTTCYMASGIYKVAAFGYSVKIFGQPNAGIGIYCWYFQIVVTYTAASGQEKMFLVTATLKATASASTMKEIELATSTASSKATASLSMLKEKGLGLSMAVLNSAATTQTYKAMLLGTFAVFGHGTTWNDYLKAIILYGAVTGNLNLWVKSWNSSVQPGFPQQPEIIFPPSLSVLFKAYQDDKPLPDVEINVYETLFNGLADSAVTDMTGRATIYLFPGDYRYEALHTRSNMTREGHFLHFTYETIEIDFGTGEVKITPTLVQVLLRMVTMLCVTALGCVCIWRLKKRDR